jgi:hypothetical protein
MQSCFISRSFSEGLRLIQQNILYPPPPLPRGEPYRAAPGNQDRLGPLIFLQNVVPMFLLIWRQGIKPLSYQIVHLIFSS